ncbi:MAG: glutamine-hydrolyzing carbamoyl-phosphate synthase small subunit [Nitrososphaerota archaeon]|nr:glutamine-hydrolyzing carbamoyl-phosphate synthase small subunit [Candidatus Bathyarchaeota archaeon]MDW8049096.1 glutamine-hydrolyzing carbamoyl-phosphate synthase small subunit [Nitrososphaerota archaeon]
MKTEKCPQRERKAVLVLEDGSFFLGYGFGSTGKVSGEVVFSTSMVGYPEALTDPSYHGQILTLTYPLIGNYGVPDYQTDGFHIPIHFESIGIKVTGLVIHELCIKPHHWASRRTLDEWLRSEGIPGIFGVDTRKLTKKLREKGVMLGILEVCNRGEEPKIDSLLKEVKTVEDPNKRDLAGEVTISEPITYDVGGRKKVVLIDCGSKASIIRNLLKRKVNVARVPYNFSSHEIMEYKPDGILISNGPGDPKKCEETIETVHNLIRENLPIMGICLGNQIISLAAGGDTYKLKYGHRSQNQPALDIESGRCYITTQNHGYATKAESLNKTPLKLWFINANDKTVEGIRSEDGKIFALQWHPEASPGPYDTEFMFDLFVNNLR